MKYIYIYTNLSSKGGVRFIEERPHLGLELLPPREGALVIRLLETELPCQFLVGGLLGIEVQPVEDCQRFLRVPMLEERVGVEERRDATTIVIRTCETLSFSRGCFFFFFLLFVRAFLGTRIKRVQSVYVHVCSVNRHTDTYGGIIPNFTSSNSAGFETRSPFFRFFCCFCIVRARGM